MCEFRHAPRGRQTETAGDVFEVQPRSCGSGKVRGHPCGDWQRGSFLSSPSRRQEEDVSAAIFLTTSFGAASAEWWTECCDEGGGRHARARRRRLSCPGPPLRPGPRNKTQRLSLFPPFPGNTAPAIPLPEPNRPARAGRRKTATPQKERSTTRNRCWRPARNYADGLSPEKGRS